MSQIKKKKVAIGMSGGVDSSVAAALLKEQGYEVLGVFLKFWSDPTYEGDNRVTNKCCSVESFMDARRVADALGIDIVTINTTKRFKELIVDNFLEAYEAGLTPNPCVICNQFVKVGYFLEIAKELGCDYIATGHYANVEMDDKGQAHLKTSKDKNKDQTYFLYRLNQETVKHFLTPIGNYLKSEVRQMAKDRNLPVAEKKDSFEISFIPDETHNDFLKRWLKPKGGEIVDTEGNVKGAHNGLMLYTLGQRQGINIGGPGGPWYVVGKNHKESKLIVTNNKDYPGLFSKQIYLDNVSWILNEPQIGKEYFARIRHQQNPFSGKIMKEGDAFVFISNEPIRAVTPGQSLVVYDNEDVVGGGIITKTI